MWPNHDGISVEAKELIPTFNSFKRRKLESSEGIKPVKLLELKSKERRNVKFPRCGGIVPPRWKPETFKAVTRRCLVPQETPIQLQMEILEDQLSLRIAREFEVMAFLKASSAYLSVVKLKIGRDEVSVEVHKMESTRAI
ncbi:hypothetical protein ACS0TY_028447 [Phlomoides rotata]